MLPSALPLLLQTSLPLPPWGGAEGDGPQGVGTTDGREPDQLPQWPPTCEAWLPRVAR